MTKAEFKQLRKKVGTQARVAGLMDVHIQTVIQWESGARAIPPARALEIARLAENPPAVASVDPVRAVDIRSKGHSYEIVITSSSGQKTISTAGLPMVRITGDAVEIVPAKEPADGKKAGR